MALQTQLNLGLAEINILYSIDIISQSLLVILKLFTKILAWKIAILSWIKIIILLVNYSTKWFIWLWLDRLNVDIIQVINRKHTIFTNIAKFTMMVVALLNLSITRLILKWICKILSRINLLIFPTFRSTRSLEWRWRGKNIWCLIIIRKSGTHWVFLIFLFCF